MRHSAFGVFLDGLEAIVDMESCPSLRRAIAMVSGAPGANSKICLSSRPQRLLTH